LAQQPDARALAHAVADFDKALLSRDTVALKWIMSDKISYGHSNGWVETKKDVIGDLYNGTLSYKQINPGTPEIITEGNTASVRMMADVDVIMSGKQLQFKLKMLQVWKWENDHWILFARQSVKA